VAELDGMYDTVLVPTDGSDAAAAALDHAVDIAGRYDATVRVLYVADTNRDSVTTVGNEVVDALEIEGQRIVADAAERVRAAGVPVVEAVETGDPVETIHDYAARVGADLVVMGTQGRTGLDRLLLGSTTERAIRTLDVPVLAVPVR
jgi:nucleotide-binding universal stress UspA family protein